MMILDGKALSAQRVAQLAAEVEDFVADGAAPPHLAAVLIGDDGASKTYVEHKVRKCAAAGFRSTLIERGADTTQEELLEIVEGLNADPMLDGFIVQLPLPAHLDAASVIEAIDPRKDVDGFHPENMGRLALGLDGFVPATPSGIVQMLAHYGIETCGKHAVVIGRSDIVGTPMALLLSRNNAMGNCTVTLCHSRTVNLADEVRRADIVVAAVGRPGTVTADMLKPGATVIDVGITPVEDATAKRGYRLKGDVDFEGAKAVAGAMTPVPGGVGPMTIIGLLENTLKAAKRRT
ncbi:MAG: bifunctional 5,10-methylenetetrahydrofolate dehydrogenase/5,10-methenyltetrahydrofolate cyclohydrolase [Flavobacteriales bacterium]|nr:bifunctional 5,10-methylenetetrahydrofolate dehydrogenase/5,10-methenyltetrahydrofolate cyclohydrolase [Flavobacteriales bacterium]